MLYNRQHLSVLGLKPTAVRMKYFFVLMIVSALSYFVTKYFEPYSVYTRKLAISGELVLNNPDFEVLNHLKLKDLVEKDFSTVPLNGTLRD